jgi:hypothetical protein
VLAVDAEGWRWVRRVGGGVDVDADGVDGGRSVWRFAVIWTVVCEVCDRRQQRRGWAVDTWEI